MERTKRIAERLPEFYRTWDADSVIFKVLDSVGRSLNEEQKSVFRIMRTHWVDTANGGDLDRLGEIFEIGRRDAETDEDYRARIKNALRQFKGGGTTSSILTLMGDYLGTHPGSFQLDENPENSISVSRKLGGGETWTVGSMSVEDAFPEIEITLEGEGDVVVNPTIRDVDSDEKAGLKGNFRVGQRLVLSTDSATLDGRDSLSLCFFQRLPTPEEGRDAPRLRGGDNIGDWSLRQELIRFFHLQGPCARRRRSPDVEGKTAVDVPTQCPFKRPQREGRDRGRRR